MNLARTVRLPLLTLALAAALPLVSLSAGAASAALPA
jgi:hypothetical protein